MGDWNDANVIVDPTNAEEVVGAIDFGDSLHTWKINDLAIAMAYAAVSSLGKVKPVQAAACLLRGYAQEVPLRSLEHETTHLLTLACGRLAISVTLGAYSYAKDPSNEYLLIHAQPAWNALHTLWYSARPKVQALFHEAMEGQGRPEELEAADFPLLSKAPSSR